MSEFDRLKARKDAITAREKADRAILFVLGTMFGAAVLFLGMLAAAALGVK